MRSWSKRPPEVANLLNPAFCALLLREYVNAYAKAASASMSVSLLYLGLPIVLHRETREALPRTTATKHHSWLEQHPHLKVGFAERCRGLVPYVREATIFACQYRLLETTDSGDVSAPRRRLRRIGWDKDGEPAGCLKAAGFVGRWLAAAGPASTVYSLWGISP